MIRNNCPFCHKVINAINRQGIQSQIVVTYLEKDLAKAAFHFETTKRNTVPCLYIKGKPMFESDDIIKYFEKNLTPSKNGN